MHRTVRNANPIREENNWKGSVLLVEPYLNLGGRAAEAMEFYEQVFHATGKMVKYVSEMMAESGYPVTEEQKGLVGYARMTVHGTLFHFSDLQEGDLHEGMISLAIRFETTEETERIYSLLLEGGEVLMKLEPQHFAKLYAWVKDKFGVNWQLMCE